MNQLRLWAPPFLDLIAKIRAEPGLSPVPLWNGEPWPGFLR